MSCFVAHMDKMGFFKQLGITVSRENAKDIEHEIARIVGREGRNCPEIWMETKLWLSDPQKKGQLEGQLIERFAH
jgi:hypothetical protein